MGRRAGNAKRGFASLLEEMGRNKKNNGGGGNQGMPNGGSRDYWREWSGTRRTLNGGGARECQTGVRVITGGNGAEQEEHWGEPGSSTRGFAWLLEEMGRNKKNTGVEPGNATRGSLKCWRNWGGTRRTLGVNQHNTGWKGRGNAKRGFA